MKQPLLNRATVALMASIAVGAHATSLYSEASYRPLIADQKARAVGDVLTVQVIETATASANVGTDMRRSNSIDVSAGNTRGINARLGLNTDSQFDGGGSSQRAGKLLAVVSVGVKEIRPNGDLMVSGEQLLEINDEKQKISLQGRVRPADISDGNIVVSTRIAEAKITYVGEGEMSERQRPSWWSRLLRALGL